MMPRRVSKDIGFAISRGATPAEACVLHTWRGPIATMCQSSGLNRDLMREVRKLGTILFADANSWLKAAESSGLHFESVNHSLLQFAKSVTLPKGVRAAGPQETSI